MAAMAGRPARSARPQRPCGSALYGCHHSQRHRRSGFVATKHPHHSSRKAMNEKFALMDLVQHHVKMSKRKGTISNGPLLYKHFLMLVFKEWTTGTRLNPTPSMKLRSFTDSNVKVATLAQDHPPSGARVKAGRQTRDARRCGAPDLGDVAGHDDDVFRHGRTDKPVGFISTDNYNHNYTDDV
ncbi:hypothetical protein FALBO_15622 [Fusarium albosuccineum]|uniref:Uncharacterized protein n=1 Tax=Fusarium albosuccineum TaxID=1237068 RepID=A0A8H4KSE3_9HYPO|nr:hypothetical protein FALBO_15622 [Fusarium albosuccineum]